METLLLILAGLAAAGILVWQFARAKNGKGCPSCSATCGCLGQKPKDEHKLIHN